MLAAGIVIGIIAVIILVKGIVIGINILNAGTDDLPGGW